jgi:3-oxoadipate enol-lactonase
VSDRIHVEDAGTGLPVLAIHGLGGSAHFFTDFTRLLQQDYRVLSIDLPGTGRSDASGEISMDRWVADLERVVAERSSEPVVVLGHSLGTMIALRAWQAWPQRIRALVLVGGLPQVRPLIRERLSQRRGALAIATNLRGWGIRVVPGVFAESTIREQSEVVTAFADRFDAQSVDSYLSCLKILLDANVTDIAPTISVPTLVVTGEFDQYAPPDEAAAFARTIPGATFTVMPQCAHLPFLERPREFAEIVRVFLRDRELGCSEARELGGSRF